MDESKELTPREELEEFFFHLNTMGLIYKKYTSEVPTKIFVNPEVIAKMSKVDGFYQREELKGIVPAHTPIVRYFKLAFGVVMLVDDWEEKFLHFE